MRKQVDKSHYDFTRYMDKRRWASIWHQLDELIALHPLDVLEIGPGNGLFRNIVNAYGINIKTLDIDSELNPDYLGQADAAPFMDKSFDVVCAFQVLEHMPFEKSKRALAECCRMARRAVVISLPDAKTSWPFTLTIPKIGQLRLVLSRPFFKPKLHTFDGEHYWEINKRGYSLDHVTSEFTSLTKGFSMKTYRVHENQYHRFFVLTKTE